MIPVYLPELDPANQERVYTKLKCEGSSCVMEQHEAAALMEEAPGLYESEEVRMTPSKFDKLPEFTGF